MSHDKLPRSQALAFLNDPTNVARLHRVTHALLDQIVSAFRTSAAVVGAYARPVDEYRWLIARIQTACVVGCRLLSQFELGVGYSILMEILLCIDEVNQKRIVPRPPINAGGHVVPSAHELVWRLADDFDLDHTLHFNYEGFNGLCEINGHTKSICRWASEIETLLTAERSDLINAIECRRTDVPAGATRAAPIQLLPQQLAILRLIARAGPGGLTRKTIEGTNTSGREGAGGTSRNTVKAVLKDFLALELVSAPKKPGGHWTITPKGRSLLPPSDRPQSAN